MANRRFSQFTDRKLAPDEPQPKPGLGSKAQPKLPGESTAAWPGPPGKGGPDFNRRVKAAKVKTHAKSSL